MKQRTHRMYQRSKTFVSSEAFFWTLLGIFVAQTSYLAYMSVFQMAFDEAYHVRLIHFFSTHANPIISTQTSFFDVGNILHSPSWLYHYLLSFPYRVLQAFGNNQATIVGLRFINIGIAVSSLLVARDLLKKVRIQRIYRNLVLGLLMFTPVFTLLSAQTNYDNAVVLVSFLLLWLTVRIHESIHTNKEFPLLPIVQWATLACFSSLIKYSVLPVVLGTGLWIVVLFVRFLKTKDTSRNSISKQISTVARPKLYLWAVMLLTGLALFTAYYGMNLVRYHSPVPQCDQVLTVDDCKQYYAWNRNYTLAQNRETITALDGPIAYTYHWVVEVWYQLYAQIIPTGGIVSIPTFFYGSLLLLSGLGVFATLSQIRSIIKRYPLLLGLTFVSFIYLVLLWARNYHDYTNLGAAVAVQGRYLAPILLSYYALLVVGMVEFMRRKSVGMRRFAGILYLYSLLLFVICGGFVSYVLHVLPTSKW